MNEVGDREGRPVDSCQLLEDGEKFLEGATSLSEDAVKQIIYYYDGCLTASG